MKSTHFICLLFILAVSCTEKNKTRPNSFALKVTEAKGIVMNADSIKPPKTIIAGPPKTIPAPTNNKLLKPKTNLPPNAHFTNFNTEQGLVLSSVRCGYYDKSGNLWFGTLGGGVSKYDGKSFTNYTTAQGLANNEVWNITEDKSGNLWFGTYGGGVSKYDGKSFTNYTTAQGLADNGVLSITEDKSGNLWFGTYGGGVSKYDGKSFTNYTTAQGLADNGVLSITEDKSGNLWFGTYGGGVSKYDGKSFANYTTAQGLANNVVWGITEDKSGNLWFGTNGGGVSKYDGKSFTNYTTAQGLAYNGVTSITEDKSGNLWFGTNGGGVSKYDGKSFTNYTTAQGLADNGVWSITEDKSENLWFGTEGGGVSKYDGKSFTNYTTAQGLANNVVLSITEDKSGNLWFGTYGGGVSKYDEKSFTNYTMAQGLADNGVLSITEDKSGNLWFGTDGGGVSKYDGKSFTNYTTAQGLANNGVLSITEDKSGNLWFGTDGGGVSKYDGKSFTNYTTAQGLADNGVTSITEDKSGNLWFGTDGGGVSKYDGKSFTNYTTAQGLADNGVTSITEDKSENLWIGTQNGLSYFVVGGGGLYTTNLQKKNDKVKSLTPTLSKGEGVKGGIQIKNYTIANGLPDNFITQILQLPNGKIAVGTNVGIAVFNPDLPLDAANKLAELELFNVSTGYPIKDVNTGQNCMYFDSKGIIWAGTGEEKISLVRFDYNAVKHNLNPPTVVIQNVKVNEQNICYYTLSSLRGTNQSAINKNEIASGENALAMTADTDSATIAQQEILTYNRVLTLAERDSIKKQFKGIEFDGITKFYPLPQNLVLPYEHNNVTFEFNCVEVNRHFMVNYQYMLEGYDKDWSPVLKKQEATYGNINEGDYVFKLKAQSPGGVWCEPITYTFTVLPPWYRTWWAYSSSGLIAFILLFGVYRWRTASLRKDKEILEQTVEERTAEVVEQKHLIEEKHKEITDSINYAERIQRALLASKTLLDENLTDYFILFKAKDVVSGDFYWATKLSNNNFVLVTADSTGHGVPGAIMSILNISCLEKAVEVEKLTSPNDILNHTRTKIIETLKKDGSAEGGKDGMDGSLLSFDFKNNILQCATANNPIWVIRNKELIEIKADRFPIGKHDKDKTPFTLHTLNLQKGDVVYTLTDGFPDQFGGASGKKFKHKQLKELLLSITNEPMETQKQKLIDVFDNWKGNLEQVDDVCLIGVRI